MTQIEEQSKEFVYQQVKNMLKPYQGEMPEKKEEQSLIEQLKMRHDQEQQKFAEQDDEQVEEQVEKDPKPVQLQDVSAQGVFESNQKIQQIGLQPINLQSGPNIVRCVLPTMEEPFQDKMMHAYHEKIDQVLFDAEQERLRDEQEQQRIIQEQQQQVNINCANCNQCIKCKDCNGCEFCQSCQKCSHCSNCSDCYNCENLINSNNYILNKPMQQLIAETSIKQEDLEQNQKKMSLKQNILIAVVIFQQAILLLKSFK